MKTYSAKELFITTKDAQSFQKTLLKTFLRSLLLPLSLKQFKDDFAKKTKEIPIEKHSQNVSKSVQLYLLSQRKK